MLVRASKDFIYGGISIAKGEFFELKGYRNDVKLLGLGYVKEAKAKERNEGLPCDCGKTFASQVELNSHREKTHKVKEKIKVS